MVLYWIQILSFAYFPATEIQGTDNFSSGLSSMGLLYPPDGLGTFVFAFFLILLLIANAGDLKENWKPPLPEGQSWLQETSD